MYHGCRAAAVVVLACLASIPIACGPVAGPQNDYEVEQVYTVEAHLAPSYDFGLKFVNTFVNVGELDDSTAVTTRAGSHGVPWSEMPFPRGQAALDRFEQFSKWIGSQKPLSPVKFENRMLVLSDHPQGTFWLVRLRISKRFLAREQGGSAWTLMKADDIALLHSETIVHPLLLYGGTEVEKPGGFKAIRVPYRPDGSGTLDNLEIEKKTYDDRVQFARVSYLASLAPKLWLADVRHDALRGDLSTYTVWCLFPRPADNAGATLQVLGGPAVPVMNR